MRLLLSAYSCCPGYGSEPGVGWNTVRQAAADPANDVHVMVATPWRGRIERNFDPERYPNVHFHYVSVPGLDPLMAEDKGHPLAAMIYYELWQLLSYFTAKRLHEEKAFDLAHHVTFVKFNTPSLLHLLGIPFLWGPLGGAEHAPAVFYREFGWKTRAAEGLRRWLQLAAPFRPLLRWTAREATLCAGVTQDTADALKVLGARKVIIMPAVALNADELAQIQPSTPVTTGKLTLLYAGRLIPWKGVHLALRALAMCGAEHLEYRIIGSGPLRSWLQHEAERLGIGNRVQFVGELSRDELLRAYASAQGFLYPSLHDSGGNAVVEAMAAALPIIHLARGGPDFLVPEEAGYKIHAETPESAVMGLSAALAKFAASPEDRAARGNVARAHALSQHAWDARGEVLRGLYAQLRGC